MTTVFLCLVSPSGLKSVGRSFSLGAKRCQLGRLCHRRTHTLLGEELAVRGVLAWNALHGRSGEGWAHHRRCVGIDSKSHAWLVGIVTKSSGLDEDLLSLLHNLDLEVLIEKKSVLSLTIVRPYDCWRSWGGRARSGWQRRTQETPQ